jgi:regulation of enolase protein 1 (concanavalin A-like superfamily)
MRVSLLRTDRIFMNMNLNHGHWINKPKDFQIRRDSVEITTEPGTDFWQRTYYGFRADNAPALLFDGDPSFTFSALVRFDYERQYDQCGLVVYVDTENWFKVSVEFETAEHSRLGSVVTNRGYSDWATRDIETPTSIGYRLSRRGPDFLIESSPGDDCFRQMRVFHLHSLGDTTAEMGKMTPSALTGSRVRFGLYACSPTNSSFKTVFSEPKLEDCGWNAHGPG